MGKRIRDERRGRDWTQAELANLLRDTGLGVYPTTIAKIEAGERAPRIEEIVAIADVFEVSLDMLVDRQPVAKDVDFALRALIEQSERALPDLESTRVALSAATNTLAALEPRGRRAKDWLKACGAVCEALATARRVFISLQAKDIERYGQ